MRVAILAVLTGANADAQRLYAMKMSPWTGSHGPVTEVKGTAAGMLADWMPAAQPVAADRNSPSLRPDRSLLPVTELASGLVGPDGIACRPGTSAIYVSEEDASRVQLVVGDSRTVAIDGTTPIYESIQGQRRAATPLYSPEGMAFSRSGSLYVIEDYPGGRLIQFTLDGNGKAIAGEVVRIPGNWSDFAMESVACNADGELLVAGSSAEKAMSGDVPSAFVGVLLYRDRNGSWWLLVRSVFESFSAAAFSPDGHTAVYACEVTGDIGWVDLRSHELRQGHSRWFAKGPEGLEVLPDGRLLVVEEHGSIVLLDPATGDHEILFRTADTLETVVYDAPRHRLLVTDDHAMKLLSLPADALQGSVHGDALAAVTYEDGQTPTHIPSTTSAFLTNLLTRCGLLPANFKQFAEHVPLIALSAVAVPMDPAHAEVDPIRIVQFLVLHPTAVTVIESGLDMPVAAFAVVTASGKTRTTIFTNMICSSMAALGLIQRDLGSVRVGLPYPFTANVSADGNCNIHFSGLTQTPDYHFVLNPEHPAESYMVVDGNDGHLWQYKLLPPHGERQAEHMVISYRQHSERDWVLLEEALPRCGNTPQLLAGDPEPPAAVNQQARCEPAPREVLQSMAGGAARSLGLPGCVGAGDDHPGTITLCSAAGP